MKNNIKVSVKTKFITEESNSLRNIFVFSYTITITNLGSIGATLLSRKWLITDENHNVEEVIGSGVVGQTPHILPKESYEYTSGVILKTDTGFMKGYYQMKNDEDEFFKAEIDVFSLVPVDKLN